MPIIKQPKGFARWFGWVELESRLFNITIVIVILPVVSLFMNFKNTKLIDYFIGEFGELSLTPIINDAVLLTSTGSIVTFLSLFLFPWSRKAREWMLTFYGTYAAACVSHAINVAFNPAISFDIAAFNVIIAFLAVTMCTTIYYTKITGWKINDNVYKSR